MEKEFHEIYPGLKIEFFKSPHSDHEGSRKQSIYDEELLINDISEQEEEGELVLNANMKAAELEAELKLQYGFNVQVYRRSNDLWFQTISTDNWTLETQNRKELNSIQDRLSQ